MFDIDDSATIDPDSDDDNGTQLDDVDVVSGAGNDTDLLDSTKDSVLSGMDGGSSDLSQTSGEPDPEVDYSETPQELAINSVLKKSVEVEQVKGKPPFANVLHQYASFNYIWTLWVLKKNDLNFPDETYRKGVTGEILLKSGSGDPDNRIELTNYKSAANPSGKFEFFIDNVRIGGITGLDKNTGNTNANSISFKILEPYSMGLFFQALQAAVAKSEYGAWNCVPLMLRLEFTGHLDQYKQKVKLPKATKYFPLKIMNISMKVDGGGCYYECTAIPWNEQAYNTVISNAKKTVNIHGSNVQEMLQKGPQSLQWQLNDAGKDVAKDSNNPNQDKVLILFPADTKTSNGGGASEDNSDPTGATTESSGGGGGGGDLNKKLGVEPAEDGENLVQNDNVNPMGLATMGFGDLQKAKQKFGIEEDVYDEKAGVFKRGNIKIEKTKGMAEFAKGSNIPTMINEIVLSSQYGRQALDNITDDGWVPWWKVETQLYLLDGDDTLKKIGRYPMLTVYRVVPTYIHSSRFLSPTDKPKGVEQLKRTAIKEYNYIYTSKNLDILEFNIEFNNSFYKQLSADLGKNNVGVETKSQVASEAVADEKEDSGKEVESGGSGSELLPVDSVIVSASGLKTETNGVVGGTADDDAGTLAARSFNDAINSSVDMIELNLKILGDPFYLGDSGMGNYTAKNTNLKGINADGAINYQSSEVFIRVNFRNPVDIDQTTGRYEFGKGKVVPQFSGLYRVGEVFNNFNKGIFTQDLKLMKMPNQDTEKQSSNSKAPTLATQIADEPPPAPTDDAGNEYEDAEGGP